MENNSCMLIKGMGLVAKEPGPYGGVLDKPKEEENANDDEEEEKEAKIKLKSSTNSSTSAATSRKGHFATSLKTIFFIL